MDFKLYVFKIVCEELSFSKAAERVAISQPAVSKNIKSLEAHYGVSLFSRKGAKIQLSKEGEYLYQKSKIILNKYKEIEDYFREINGNTPTSLTIGCSTTISQFLLPSLLIKIQIKYPKLSIELRDANSRIIEQMISDEIIDFGIVEGNHHHKDLKYHPFVKDEIVLIHKASSEPPISIKKQDLESLRLVRRELGSGTDAVLETHFTKHHIHLNESSMRIGSTQGIKTMIEENPDFYAFVSIHAIKKELKNNKLEIIDVEDLEIHREFNFVTRHGNQNHFFQQIQNDLLRLSNQ
ncbi:LysR family transcriptional regulator [Flavobacteriaceae bacterium]|nr:LysR family transcriptional regulator [Flavobacteriaceae bacterium]